MAAGVDRADDVTGNAVSFITFNYDVSLERFLFNAIRAGFGLDDAHALKIAQSIPVHHVYGALAPTERDRYLSHDHWGALKTEVLQACARQIHVMPHQRPARDERCAELLSQAFNTVFLGFGFDEMNCLRLGVKEVMRGQDPLRLPFGTALGTYGEERDVAEERISSNVMGRLFDLNCLQVLRKLSARIV